MRKIVTVLGARPQFIKASVVSYQIKKTSNINEIILNTGQHFDANMSDVFFEELGMSKPDYSLSIHGGTHGAMTGRMLAEVEQVLLSEKPDTVLVYGDTNSTLAGALAAVKLHIPVAHVEAGLRSFNMKMPEEVNRILTDRISNWLFTPTKAATTNLCNEGFCAEKIHTVGDVMYDVAVHHGLRVQAAGGLLSSLDLCEKGYVLATVHRAENTDHPDRLSVIVEALIRISRSMPVVWPLHPRTRNALKMTGKLDVLGSMVKLTEPLGYMKMVELEKFAALIATDSGGVQKEAFFHKVPCITLREETEWVELIEAGWNRLAPPSSPYDIVNAAEAALRSSGKPVMPYGTGHAAEKIVKILKSY
jgi:UDP-GlcNAc3NAcA epimerase